MTILPSSVQTSADTEQLLPSPVPPHGTGDEKRTQPPLSPASDSVNAATALQMGTPKAIPSVKAQVTVAGYEILGELGRGAMGVVYKAKQLGLNRLVALKMILSGSHAGEQELLRFHAEAESIAALHHPNIVQIYEVSESDGRPFFSMEFVEGGSLDRKIQGMPQPIREAATLMEYLARAMDEAHQHGVIHRDLKPANILLSADGQPKITDFGLAKRLMENDPYATNPGYATQTGTTLGTPSYMAPEQAAGKTKEVGPLSDIYSLGAILYELLTGRPPFRAATPMDTLLLVVTEEPVRPSQLQPKIARDLQTICLKCLEKDPHKRYASAGDLADDLRRFLDGEPIQAQPISQWQRSVKWARRRPAMAALIAVSLLALVGFIVGSGWYQMQLSQALHKAEAEKHLAVERAVRLNIANASNLMDTGDLLRSLPLLVEALRLEPGGAAREEMHRIRLAAVLRECPRLTQVWYHDGWLTSAEFSPDSRHVVTAGSDNQARIWDTSTGEAVGPPLRHEQLVSCASFSPDNRWVLTASRDGTARLWDAATGQPLLPPMQHGQEILYATFSPDGASVLTAGVDGLARIWEKSTGRQVFLLNHGKPVKYAAFSSDGQWIVTAGGAKAQMWEAKSGRQLEPALLHQGTVNQALFAPDSRHVITVSDDRTARLWDPVSRQPSTPILQHGNAVRRACFNQTSDRVITGSDDGNARIWDTQTGRTVTVQLRHKSFVTDVSFAPDGKYVISGSDDGTARVWDAVTGLPVGPMLVHNGTVMRTVFSPDGKSGLTGDLAGRARLWKRGHLQPSREFHRHRPEARTTFQSRDGKYQVTVDNHHLLQARNVQTGERLGLAIQVPGAVQTVAFSPDPHRVATASDDGLAQIWDLSTGQRVSQPLRHASRVYTVSFNGDGTKVVTGSDDDTARVWNAATGDPISSPMVHHGTVYRAFFSPDSRFVVTASEDGVNRVWDAATGEPITPPMNQNSWVEKALQAPEDPHHWDLPVDNRPVELLRMLAEYISSHRIDRSGNLVPLERGGLGTSLQILRSTHPGDIVSPY